MAKDPKRPAGGFEGENTGGLLSGFLAEEHQFDRRALWRVGSWGVAAVSAVQSKAGLFGFIAIGLPFLSEQAKRNILGLNAARIFNLDPTPVKKLIPA